MALYAFDGTWNMAKDAGEYGRHTNVVAFHNLYTENRCIYNGVGTRYSIIGKILGGAFGVGGKERINRASRDLAKFFASGDREIDIIGFSRGAALAIHFANVIAAKGVRDPENGAAIDPAPRIRFLGLWDMVASFGVPISIGIPFQRINLGYRLKLPTAVEYCFHALALDELRQTFWPTRVKGSYQVWFRGVHSDVGGGNDNKGLSNIALGWMLQKAMLVGLPVPPCLPDDLEMNPDAPIRPARMDKIKNKPREVVFTDWIHHTVSNRPDHNNPPPELPREGPDESASRIRLTNQGT
ncbi:MAG: DUF2235 domain-containing protein [Candidatus Saganbacteria bacterium]|nr:DUF2235 domain-containing protein [Candidatus Saganbacteria bacterium]